MFWKLSRMGSLATINSRPIGRHGSSILLARPASPRAPHLVEIARAFPPVKARLGLVAPQLGTSQGYTM
jgi:hypothetical protein